MNSGTWWKTEDVEPTRHTKHHFYYVPQLVSAARALWPPPVVAEWAALKTFIVEHLKRLRRRQVVCRPPQPEFNLCSQCCLV